MVGQKQARDRSARPAAAGKAPVKPPGQVPARPQSAARANGRPPTRRARDRARARELAEQRAAAGPAAAAGPPLWVQLTSLALAVFGLGASIYLTVAHYTSPSVLACSDQGAVNCAAVTTSPEATVFGVFPVAVLGLAFFVFVVAICSPWAWRSGRPEIAWARLGSLVAGIGFVLYLIYVELFQVRAICLWCTGIHVATFLLFVLVVLAAAVWGTGQRAGR